MFYPTFTWTARIVSSLHFKLKSCTLIWSLLKVKLSEEFCSDMEWIWTILSAAWNKTKSSTPTFRFLGDILGMVRVLKSDGLDFESIWILGSRSGALLEEGTGRGLPRPFSKIGKLCPKLEKKCPDCGHLWVKLSIQIAFRSKNRKIFLGSLSFSCCRWLFIEMSLFQKKTCTKKFLVTRHVYHVL